MRKILWSLVLFSALSFNSLHAKGLDFHIGAGYGGEPGREKQEFSSVYAFSTDYVSVFDIFLGLGWTFIDIGPLGFAAGLEYQHETRSAFLSHVKIQTEGNGTLRRGSFKILDQYTNAYIKMKFNVIPFFPLTLTGTFGLGFRTPLGSWEISNAKNNILDSTYKLTIGYKMGARATLGFLYLGMDYTIFPRIWKNNPRDNATHTFAMTGGLSWTF